MNDVLRRRFSLQQEELWRNRPLREIADGLFDVPAIQRFFDDGLKPVEVELVSRRPIRVRLEGRRFGGSEPCIMLVFVFEQDHAAHLDQKRAEIHELAYEIRTPLTSVYGFSELLLNRDFPPEQQREFLELIYQEAGRLADRVEALLELDLNMVEDLDTED